MKEKLYRFNYTVINFRTMKRESGNIEVTHFTVGEATNKASDILEFRYPSKKGYLVEINEEYVELEVK